MPCPARHHRWAANPPTVGTKCIKCPAIFGIRAPKVTSPEDEQARAARIAQAFQALKGGQAPSVNGKPSTAPVVEASSVNSDVIQPDEVLPPSAARPNGWQKGAARKLRRVFFGALDLAIEAVERIPGEPEDDDLEDVEESFARSLAVWFPEGSLSPTKDLILACTFAGAAAWSSSKAKPRVARPADPQKKSSAPTEEPSREPSPPDPKMSRALTVFGDG